MKNRYTRALNDVHLTEEFREKLGGALRTPPLLNRPYQEKPTAVKPAWYRRKPYIAAGTAAAAVTLTILVLLTTFTRSHLPPLPIDSSVVPTTGRETTFSTEEASSAATSEQSTTNTKPDGSTAATRTTTSKVSAATTVPTTRPSLPRLPCTPGVIPPKCYLETGGWTNENSLIVSMKKAVADTLSWSPADFPEAKVTQVVYTAYQQGESLELLLVVDLADGDTLEAAANRLKANAAVETVQPNREVPFESVMVPTYTKIQLRVGETMELGILGGRLYAQGYSHDCISVTISDDSSKIYTVEDFPELDLNEVKKYESYSLATEWKLYLKKPGYFALIESLDTMIKSHRFSSVSAEGLCYTTDCYIGWTISDPEIAMIKETGTSEYAQTIENNNITIKALHPGKTALDHTYNNYASATAFCEVEVVPE